MKLPRDMDARELVKALTLLGNLVTRQAALVQQLFD